MHKILTKYFQSDQHIRTESIIIHYIILHVNYVASSNIFFHYKIFIFQVKGWNRLKLIGLVNLKKERKKYIDQVVSNTGYYK
jgi:hypothetical protein